MAKKFALVAAVCLGAAASLVAQMASPAQRPPAVPPTAAQQALLAPTYADIYCAGFFTRRFIEPGLFVVGSPEGGYRYEFTDRDIVYLSGGRKQIKVPGGQYMLVRPVKDMLPVEAFPGQHVVIAGLGTHYAEIARIQVEILNAGTATAQILTACEPVEDGDIAIPFTVRPAPLYKSAMFPERFAPSSGKPAGLIATVKGFQQTAGTGQVVYLSLGKKQGVQVGSYLRIFRRYSSPSQDMIRYGMQNYPTEMMGVPQGRKPSPQEMTSLPRTVLGELMILAAEEESSTGIVVYSLADIYAGDEVEIE